MIPSPDAGTVGWRVSVVIPVKDDAAPLRACLDALALQSRPVDEIVVVDNRSEDDSALVARAARARVVRCDADGIPAAAALGYDAADGDVILRLDADCVPERHWVARMVGALAATPDAAAVSGGARFVDGPRPMRAPAAAVYLGAYVLLAIAALGHPPVFGSNLAMRRTAWLAVREHVHRDDPELHDDLDLAFHLGERDRVRWLGDTAMGMSMRPFGTARGFATRIVRGLRTVVVHWPADFPPLRWARRIGVAIDGAGRGRRLVRRGGRP